MCRQFALINFLLGIAAFTNADSCLLLDHFEGRSGNGRFLVRMDWNNEWRGRIEDTKSGKASDAVMPGLGSHAHFSIFVADDGSRIIVLDSRLTIHEAGFLLVYDRDLKLLKGFDIKELLSKIDLAAIIYTVSHCRFAADSRDGEPSIWLEEDDKTFAIYLRSKRTVMISLAEPKIIPTPDVIPEVFEFEDGPPPGDTDHEKFQGQWMVTECRSGPRTMPREEDARDNPSYVTFKGDTILGSLSGIDKRKFNLDSSLHAIDLTGPGKLKGIYEFKGGTLRLCLLIETGIQRPKKFDDETITYWTYTLRRRKVKRERAASESNKRSLPS